MKTRLSNGAKKHPELELKRFPTKVSDLNFDNYYAGILRNEYNQDSFWILNNDDVTK